ncbi:MAG TPA: hypothetical protein VGO00_18705 [Kofleriaceae bacterium]|nr:hypothetical protein [Kofleriaceae bacterium]
MAARIPRRSFATPFVVTFTAACSTTTQPPPPQPPPTETPSGPIATAPPTDPSTVDQTPTPTPTPPEVIHRNPPPPDVTPPPRNPPPPPPPPPEDRQWTVFKHGAKCEAMIKVECPHGAPGQPMPTCNPPPAHDYACPPGMTDTPMTIVTRGAICVIQPGNQSCPPNMHCNPPPQRKVPCPE